MPWTDLDTLFGLLRPCVTGEALAAFFAGLSVDVRQDLAHIGVPNAGDPLPRTTKSSLSRKPSTWRRTLGAHDVHALQGARHHLHPSYNDEIARAVTRLPRCRERRGRSSALGKGMTPGRGKQGHSREQVPGVSDPCQAQHRRPAASVRSRLAAAPCTACGGWHAPQAGAPGVHPAPGVATCRGTSAPRPPASGSTTCPSHCCGAPWPPGGARTSRPGWQAG